MPAPIRAVDAALTDDVSTGAQPRPRYERPPNAAYVILHVVVLGFVAVVVSLTRGHAAPLPDARVLLPPIFALVALTAVVFLLMLVARNVAILRGTIPPDAFLDPTRVPAHERIERPARTFNNLLELPMLFYVVCLLHLSIGTVDDVQLRMAWAFVITRIAHAIIYVGFNYVPLRLALWLCGCIALGVMWTRLALTVL